MLPFRISIYDKGFSPLDWVGAPLEVRVTVRLNAAASATFTLDSDDEQVGVLTAPGARCVIEYVHDPENPNSPMFLLSGALGERDGESSATGTRTFEVFDDFAYVMGFVGVPNPAGDITEQGGEDAYYTVTGPAETVLKAHVDAVAGWYGVPVTTATDLGRGAATTVAVRMHPLKDRLFPAITNAGVRVTVRQSGAGIVVDCTEPTVLTTPLTEASGVVKSGKFHTSPPTITRVIVGGGGEGTARVWALESDAALEAEWGMVLPAVIDARDTSDPAVLSARALAKLAEGAPTAGVSAALAETDDFRFGVTVDIGDIAPVQLLGAPTVEDHMTEVELTYTVPDDLLVTPHVGEAPVTYGDLVTAAINEVARRTRDQDARS